MSAPAWSALADCFAALAAEQEFRFTTHPFDSTTAFQDDAARFRFAYPFGGRPSSPALTGIVIGLGPFQRGEFVRINRLRWLSWSAGLLLGADPCTPAEVHWWRHLRETHQDRIETGGDANRTTLPNLASLSAEAARRLAGSIGLTPSPSTGAKTDNWPTFQASFRILRERFNAERWHTARPDAALVSFPDHTAFDMWKQSTIERGMPGPTEPRAWSQRGTIWGDPEPVDAFVNLATDAGTSLPLELSFTPPLFPWFNCTSNMHPTPEWQWLEFLFIVCSASFTLQEDSPVPTSRVVRLTTSAFTTSVSAIDRLLSLDGQSFLRLFRENAVRCNPWLNEADRAAARSAVETSARPDNSSPAGTPPTITPARVALDEACRLTLSALRAARTLPIHRTHFNRENCIPTLSERCETVGEQVSAAHNAVAQLVLAFRAVTRYTADRPFCGKFWASAHEAAVEAANDLLWRFHLACGDPGESPEDLVYAALEGEVEKEHAAAVARFCTGQPESPRLSAPQQPAPVPDGCLIETFGDLLMNVRSVEEAAASLRATADSMGGEPGTEHWRIQAAFYEADAEFKKHQSFPVLEAHVNRQYGPFTYANLLRVRGEVCAIRRCGTNQADQLSVEEVVAVLNCPVADQPPRASGSRQVNTRPTSVEPPRYYVDAAMRALPGALNNAPQPEGVHDPAGRRGSEYATLRQRLEGAAHNRDAAEWAIHRHVEAGRLEAAPGLTASPGVHRDGGWVAPPVTNHTYERERCVLWATPALWEWWREIEYTQNPLSGASVTASAPEKHMEQPPAGYTMADIRDLLRYKRDYARYEALCRSMFKPILRAEEVGTQAAAMAFNCPQPARLREETANALAVYRRLLRDSLDVLRRELDESALLYFVGEVADRHERRIEEMWSISTDEFGRLMNGQPVTIPASGTVAVVSATAELIPPPEPAPAVIGTNEVPVVNPPACVKSDRKEGGRPKLGEGPSATPQDRALRNVYELVRGAAQPGWGPKSLVSHFRENKDFKQRVKEARKEFDEALFKNALAWIKENPDQETESGNVS